MVILLGLNKSINHTTDRESLHTIGILIYYMQLLKHEPHWCDVVDYLRRMSILTRQLDRQEHSWNEITLYFKFVSFIDENMPLPLRGHFVQHLPWGTNKF